MVKVTVKTDWKDFRREQRKYVNSILSSSGKVCRDAVGVYFRWLAQFAPPSIGSVELRGRAGNDIYLRPAMLLPVAIARGGKSAAQDRVALSQGYSWKLIKRGKAEYFKGNKSNTMPPRVKRARHIVNRGLLRWAFVGVLPNVGVAVPVVMRPLATNRRGKDLKKNERLVASASLSMGGKELRIRVEQNVRFASTGGWYSTAQRIAEENHFNYTKMMLSRFGKVTRI